MKGESSGEHVGETEQGAAAGASTSAHDADQLPKDHLREIERIVVRLEGQVLGLQQRVVELEGAQRVARKRALLFRLALLVALLSVYVLVHARYAG